MEHQAASTNARCPHGVQPVLELASIRKLMTPQ
jgi:hypothetical protein